MPVSDDADMERWLELRNRLIPDWPMVVEQLRASREHEPLRLDFLAEDDDELVGGGVGTRGATSGPGRGYVSVWVVPERRRNGVGSKLLAHAFAHCESHGIVRTTVLVRETNEAGLAFAAWHGFSLTGRSVQLELDLASAVLPELELHEEIEVGPHSAAELRALWAIECEALPDVPGFDAEVAEPFERWRDRALTMPGYRPETFMVARSRGVPIGFAQLRFDGVEEGTAEHEFTGVLRAWRGRGVAAALKHAQVAWAKEVGLRKLLTENEDRNEPIRRVNAALGYAPTPAWLLLEVDRSNQSE